MRQITQEEAEKLVHHLQQALAIMEGEYGSVMHSACKLIESIDPEWERPA